MYEVGRVLRRGAGRWLRGALGRKWLLFSARAKTSSGLQPLFKPLWKAFPGSEMLADRPGHRDLVASKDDPEEKEEEREQGRSEDQYGASEHPMGLMSPKGERIERPSESRNQGTEQCYAGDDEN